ncbi:hypothetical protein EBR21_04595, partial [bacterium]|nr:hypothetical protein [bacterium]
MVDISGMKKKHNSAQFIYVFMCALIGVCSIFLTPRAFALVGDTTWSQRAGYIISKGDLSRDTNHLGLMITMTRTFHGPMKFLNSEVMHRFSALYD